MKPATQEQGIIALDNRGNIRRILGQDLSEIITDPTIEEKKISQMKSRTVEFIENPFFAVGLIQENKIIDEYMMETSVFHLHSPFDYINGIKKYRTEGIVYPLDLNVDLSDLCNFSCVFCCNKEERESKKPNHLDFKTYLQVIDYFVEKEPLLTQSISSGQSGEAILHPKFIHVLAESHTRGIRTFMTTNGSRSDDAFIDAIARYVTVAVFSVHGTDNISYTHIQHPPKGRNLDSILDTIQKIDKKRRELGREHALTLRVLTCLHPLNAGHYTEFFERLNQCGVNHVSLNPILPHPSVYGIHFSPETIQKISEELDTIEQMFSGSRIRIRLPKPYFPEKLGAFYNPKTRKNQDICFATLFQPNLSPIYDRVNDSSTNYGSTNYEGTLDGTKQGSTINQNHNHSKLTACRFYPIITNNKSYWYSDTLGADKIEKIWTPENLTRIQTQTLNCTQCSYGRLMRALDWMLTHIDREPNAEFVLLYNPHADGSTQKSILTCGRDEG